MRELAPPHIPRALTDREEKLDILLQRWNDVAPMMAGTRTDFGAGESGVSMMPLAWNLSYRKLEVILRYMTHVAETGSAEFRGRRFHLCEWYGRGKWRRGTVMEIEARTGKKVKTERMIFHGGSQAEPKKVVEALDWIQGHFPGEVYLPADFVATIQEQMNPKRRAA